MRISRRAVRDYNFRGTDVKGTLDMWANVRRGEKLYISPYKQTAHMLFDSSLPYEVSVMACYARPPPCSRTTTCECSVPYSLALIFCFSSLSSFPRPILNVLFPAPGWNHSYAVPLPPS